MKVERKEIHVHLQNVSESKITKGNHSYNSDTECDKT